MNMFDVPQEDRWMIWLVGIIASTITTIILSYYISEYAEAVEAFENGYEQVIDPGTIQALWKKSRKE